MTVLTNLLNFSYGETANVQNNLNLILKEKNQYDKDHCYLIYKF